MNEYFVLYVTTAIFFMHLNLLIGLQRVKSFFGVALTARFVLAGMFSV